MSVTQYFVFKNEEEDLEVVFTDSWKNVLERCRVSQDQIRYQGKMYKFSHSYSK